MGDCVSHLCSMTLGESLFLRGGLLARSLSDPPIFFPKYLLYYFLNVILHVYVFCLHVWMCILCVLGAYGGKRSGFDHLVLEL